MNDETIDRIDALLKHHGDEGAIVTVSPSLASPSSEEDFEDAYQKIGWWKGPNATPETRRGYVSSGGSRAIGAWAGSWAGSAGSGTSTCSTGSRASWPRRAVPPSSRSSMSWSISPGADQAEALLKALGWMGEGGISVPPTSAKRLEAALLMFLHQDEAGLREWATRAVRVLPREQASAVIGSQLDGESDPDVRQAIEEMVAAIEIGRA